MMQDFAKLVNGQEPLTNLTKRSITCVQQGPVLFLECCTKICEVRPIGKSDCMFFSCHVHVSE